MILHAIDRGGARRADGEALGLDVQTIRKRKRMLEGICSEAIEILNDTPCPIATFDILRRMASIWQINAAELMMGQNNFTAVFAKAILAATPDAQLVDPRKKKLGGERAVTVEQIARMERELASLQAQVKSVEETYGIDNLHLMVTKGYIRKHLGNARVVRWLTQRRQEYLSEFQFVAEIESLAPLNAAAE